VLDAGGGFKTYLWTSVRQTAASSVRKSGDYAVTVTTAAVASATSPRVTIQALNAPFASHSSARRSVCVNSTVCIGLPIRARRNTIGRLPAASFFQAEYKERFSAMDIRGNRDSPIDRNECAGLHCRHEHSGAGAIVACAVGHRTRPGVVLSKVTASGLKRTPDIQATSGRQETRRVPS